VGRVNRGREDEPRRVYQPVTLTEQEQEQLRERAAALRVSVPRLMVEAALSGVETPAQRRVWIAELFELRRLLATVANNVNQLAKVANTSGELPAGDRLPRTLGEVDELLVLLREWMGVRR
jgi:mobilization protein NikA